MTHEQLIDSQNVKGDTFWNFIQGLLTMQGTTEMVANNKALSILLTKEYLGVIPYDDSNLNKWKKCIKDNNFRLKSTVTTFLTGGYKAAPLILQGLDRG